jgi:hypothetical protein
MDKEKVMSKSATVDIPDDVITPIVEAQIQAGIVQALGGRQELIEGVVSRALTRPVDPKTGRAPEYSHTTTKTYLSWACMQAINSAAKNALDAWLESHEADIAAAIEAELHKKKAPLARQIIAALLSGASSRGIEITLALNERK